MDAKLSPSELFFVAILNALIQKDAREQSQMTGDTLSATQSILCFLGDKIVNNRVPQYNHLDDAIKDLEAYMPRESTFRSNFLNDLKYESPDDLVDYIDTLNGIFENPPGLSPNAVHAPTNICKNSVLGYFIRYFLARWRAMSFEAVAAFYDLQIQFMDHAYVKLAPKLSMPKTLLREAETAAVIGDMMAAEDAIHKLFDCSGNIPISTQTAVAAGNYPSFEASIHQSAAVASSLQSLATKGPMLSHNRHQQAMMSLATVWSRNKHHGLALSAVEEAMKTAHQRGDHAAVAKALLLLFHTINNGCSGQHQLEFQLDGDDILQRCLERADSGLHLISAQATILLSQLRSKSILRGYLCSSFGASAFSAIEENLGSDSSDGFAHSAHGVDSSDESEVGIGSVRAVWTLLLTSQFGDTGLNSMAAKGSSPQQQTPPTKSASGRAAPADTSVLQTSQSGAVALPATTVAADFWSRLGAGSMAELQCRRGLRQFLCVAAFASRSENETAIEINWEELAAVCCRIAKLAVDNVFPLWANEPTLSNYRDAGANRSCNHFDSMEMENLEEAASTASAKPQRGGVAVVGGGGGGGGGGGVNFACRTGLRLIKLTTKALRLRLSPAGRAVLDSTRHYVLGRAALAQGHIGQAIEHAESLQELNRPVEATSQWSRSSNDVGGGPAATWTQPPLYLSPALAQAALVAAVTMARYDPAGAARSLDRLAQCEASDVLQESLMAQVLQACLLLRVELSHGLEQEGFLAGVGSAGNAGGSSGSGGGGSKWVRENSYSLQARLSLIALREAVAVARAASFPAVEAFAHGALAEWTFATFRI